MSNITNIIISLQERLKTIDSTIELAIIAKAIEKLKTGSVTVVENFSDLPITEQNRIFLVSSEGELYYNVGSSWYSLGDIFAGNVYGWGQNTNGQLGDGTTISKSSPVDLVGGIVGWSQVSASAGNGRHCLGIAGGIAYAWGYNLSGRLGDNSTSNRSSPVTVVGNITNWSQVSAGETHSLGIAGGIAYAWGAASGGQLGNGDNVTSLLSPITVLGGITNWSQVSAGKNHSLGLTSSGVAYGWGNDVSGRVGNDDSSGFTASPVTVVGGITNWSQVSAGSEHSLGIAGGIAYAWGNGSSGRLGSDSIVSYSSPVTVVGGITNWSQVSAGSTHSLGIAGGIAYAWGAGSNGQLGDDTAINKSSPVTVVGGITNWSQVSAGGGHSLGIANGALYSWGCNAAGQLGDDTAISKSSPVTVVGGITTWSYASAGSTFNTTIYQKMKTYNT